MYNDVEDLRKELEILCEDYIDVISNLKYKNEISEDTFDRCVKDKILFLSK